MKDWDFKVVESKAGGMKLTIRKYGSFYIQSCTIIQPHYRHIDSGFLQQITNPTIKIRLLQSEFVIEFEKIDYVDKNIFIKGKLI